MNRIKADQVIDVKELQCPRPLLKTKQTLETMKSGNILEVITTDSTTKLTIPSYLKRSGDQLITVDEENGVIYHYIKKK